MQQLQYKGICHCRYAPLALSGPVRMPSNQLSVRQIRYMQFYFVGEIVVITTIHIFFISAFGMYNEGLNFQTSAAWAMSKFTEPIRVHFCYLCTLHIHSDWLLCRTPCC